MSVHIVEERQRGRCPPAAAPFQAAARRPAGFVARSSHTTPGIARRSRLTSGTGGRQQNAKLFLREPLEPATFSPYASTGQNTASLVEAQEEKLEPTKNLDADSRA